MTINDKLKKAIEDKATEFKKLSCKDVANLCEAYKFLCEAEAENKKAKSSSDFWQAVINKQQEQSTTAPVVKYPYSIPDRFNNI